MCEAGRDRLMTGIPLTEKKEIISKRNNCSLSWCIPAALTFSLCIPTVSGTCAGCLGAHGRGRRTEDADQRRSHAASTCIRVSFSLLNCQRFLCLSDTAGRIFLFDLLEIGTKAQRHQGRSEAEERTDERWSVTGKGRDGKSSWWQKKRDI